MDTDGSQQSKTKVKRSMLPFYRKKEEHSHAKYKKINQRSRIKKISPTF